MRIWFYKFFKRAAKYKMMPEFHRGIRIHTESKGPFLFEETEDWNKRRDNRNRKMILNVSERKGRINKVGNICRQKK